MTETVRVMYDFESSASQTKTGIIDITKRVKARNTLKNVIKIPSMSGIFQCFSFTTNGPRRSAKKQEIKKRPTKSRKI